MGIRDKMRRNVQPHLGPGEVVQAVFPTQTASPWFMGVPLLFLIVNRSVAVAVTNQRIILGKPATWTSTNFSQVSQVLPRQTVIGPPTGVVWYKNHRLGRQLYVHRRFHDDVREADSHLGPSPLLANSAPPFQPAPFQPGYPAQDQPNPGYPAQGQPDPGYPTQGQPNPGYQAQDHPNPGFPTQGPPGRPPGPPPPPS